MALDTAFYLVTRDIAIRSGLVGERYHTKDGRYVLDNKDLSRVRFTTDEYINGLKGVEKITEEQAASLIAEAGYDRTDAGTTESAQEAQNAETPANAEAPAAEETPAEAADEAPAEEPETKEEPSETEENTKETEETNEEKEVDNELDK
jgi:hypothetical protein